MAEAAADLRAAAGQSAGSSGRGPLRLGFVGVGGRGSYHLDTCLGLDSVEVKALCDINPNYLYRAKRYVEEAGKPSPAIYDRGPHGLDAAVRARRPGRGHHRHALAVARSYLRRRHEGRQTLRHRSARRPHAGRVLGTGGDLRKDWQELPHAGAGELYCRTPAPPAHGADRSVRRGSARGRRLRARPAAGEVRSRARAVAHEFRVRPQRQSVPHAPHRADRVVAQYQPRRPFSRRSYR